MGGGDPFISCPHPGPGPAFPDQIDRPRSGVRLAESGDDHKYQLFFVLSGMDCVKAYTRFQKKVSGVKSEVCERRVRQDVAQANV